MAKIYYIHDNGGRPFRVEVNGKNVSVYMNMDTFKKINGTFQDVSRPEKHLFDVVAEKVFIGKKSPKGGYDGLKPKEAEGNSILLHLGEKYMFIGEKIYEFKPMKGDSIKKFYSNIGNSDVPYPYAIGEKYVYILLSDHMAVEKSFFDMKDDIYQQFYEATTYLPMCLRGHQSSSICVNRAEAKARIAELKEKQKKFSVKVIQKRKY